MSRFPEVKIEIPQQDQEQEGDASLSSCSSSEPFALQVLGDSMEPEFPDKCIVVIEPNDKCSHSAYVMANIEGSRWFRQYINDDKGERLVAVNDTYPDIPLDGLNWKIEGIIVQRNIKREVKHYEVY